MGKKKGEKPEGEEAFVKKEKGLAKKAEKKAEKKRQRQEREQALEARIAALEMALQEKEERTRETNFEEQSVKEAGETLLEASEEYGEQEQEASEEYGEQEQEALEKENPGNAKEKALEEENLNASEEEKSIHSEDSETVVIEEASERREIPVFVEARSSFFSPALSSSGAIKEFLQTPKLLRGEIREYLADPEEAMLKEKEKTGHKSTSLLFTISLLLMFFIGLYLSNGNPAASLQFSLLYALSFLLLPFFLVLFFSEGKIGALPFSKSILLFPAFGLSPIFFVSVSFGHTLGHCVGLYSSENRVRSKWKSAENLLFIQYFRPKPLPLFRLLFCGLQSAKLYSGAFMGRKSELERLFRVFAFSFSGIKSNFHN